MFGLIVAAIAYFSIANFTTLAEAHEGDIRLIRVLGILLFFITISVTGFTFLGVTQETSSHYPMSKKRALWYAGAAGSERGLIGALGVLIAFVLPSAGIFTFLVLSEKDRSKEWVKRQREEMIKTQSKIWNDPVTAARFGMISGAIWIMAAGIFILLGFLIGFKFSWLVFIFATAIQLLVQAVMVKPEEPWNHVSG
ncbi:hypothetical protein [Leadbettera azotonutricia]|uniref:hypothetical protein n=1 Tax=Leadbettera azotonutricia TaxID=150829 RepID=UPI0002D6FB05|nr:hypothetical protein [Leadbettera azotonutricia]